MTSVDSSLPVCFKSISTAAVGWSSRSEFFFSLLFRFVWWSPSVLRLPRRFGSNAC